MDKETTTILIAVYGTLRQGGINHWLMRKINACYLTSGFIPGFGLYGGSFPFAAPNKDAEIFCEIYIVDEKGLMELDEFEGVQSAMSPYSRTSVNVPMLDNVSCYMYTVDSDFLGKAKKEPLPGGDYIKFCRYLDQYEDQF